VQYKLIKSMTQSKSINLAMGNKNGETIASSIV